MCIRDRHNTMSRTKQGRLLRLIQTPVSPEIVKFLVQKLASQLAETAPTAPSLTQFITNLINASNVPMTTLLVTATYIDRFFQLVHSKQTIPHHVFLGCLIIATKFVNDYSIKNLNWSQYTDSFIPIHQVNLIERQILNLFQYNLTLGEDAILQSMNGFNTNSIPLISKEFVAIDMDYPSASSLSYPCLLYTSRCV